jgi:hypothetical protein
MYGINCKLQVTIFTTRESLRIVTINIERACVCIFLTYYYTNFFDLVGELTMLNKSFGLLITVAVTSAPLSAFAQQAYDANTQQQINNLTEMFKGAMDGTLPINGSYRRAGEAVQPTNNAVGNFNQTSQSIIDNYQRTINNIEAQSAASPGYQAPSTTCNFNVYTPSPNNSTSTNAAFSWANAFNNFGGKWMPRITGKTTQQLYGC